MRLIIDGHEYELDGNFFVDRWIASTAPYVDPDAPEGRRFSDVRLALKVLLRTRLSGILKLFAGAFHVDDWRTLRPARGEDTLMTLHSYIALMMRAEAQNLILEMVTTPSESLLTAPSAPREQESSDSDDTQRRLGNDAPTRLTLTSARFVGVAKALYERPNTGRQVGESIGQHSALGPVTSGGGLVTDAQPSAVRERSRL